MIFLKLAALAVALWILFRLFRLYKVKTLPREAYLKVICEEQAFTKGTWVNEIMIRTLVSRLLGKKLPGSRHAFNLRRMVQEGLIEHKEGTTWFSGEVEIPVATFQATQKGWDTYQGSPP